jgi:uncharacterized membrane protein HdeD (DUF308 family)
MSDRVRWFLKGSGWVLLAMGVIRIYRLLRFHAEEHFFTPQLLGASVSFWMATSILRVAMQKKEMTRKGAIPLIRSGSVLLAIWSYRVYQILKKSPSPLETKVSVYLGLIYIVFGTVVMLLGLRISRTLRNKTIETPSSAPLATLSEGPAKK